MGENDFFGNSQGSDGSSVGGGDSYVEETTTGWSSRIAGSFAGILVGIVFVVGAFVLLFWNEGRTIKTTRALQEAGRVFVALDRPVVDPANNGKLVYATGDASADEILSDKTFGISSKAIRLQRLVETYQWKEHEKSETTKNVGGSTTTRKTYTYEKTWSDSIIDSYAFKKPEGHMNPTQVALSRQDIWAKQVHFGGFSLPRSLLQQLDNFEPVAIDASVLGSLPAPYKDKAQIVDEWCYLGKANEPTMVIRGSNSAQSSLDP